MLGLFKRINFFKGLFMEAGDWKNEQTYHIEKKRFHNKYLHRPGVVLDSLGGLKVTVADSGTTLIIAPGYGIDGEGHDLYLPEEKQIDVPALDYYEPPTTIYLSMAYKETRDTTRKSDANPKYTGDAYITEDIVIEIDKEEPDNHIKIELARISLSKKPKYIRNAKDPKLPQTDEVDMTHVPQAGARTATIQKELGLDNFAEKMMDTKVQVRAGIRKQDDTGVLIEKIPAGDVPPMYMVSVHALDGARTHWWIECTTKDKTSDYSLHIKSEANRATTVLCRVFKIRL